MGAIDISIWGLVAAFALLIPPLIIDHHYHLNLRKDILISVGRMSIQLFVVGFFLEYIFQQNLWWLNLIWFFIMVGTAILSTVDRLKINIKPLLISIIISFTLPTLGVLFYFNAFVIKLDYLFDARYLIALGGMLLGNVLSTNIVGLNSFYQSLKDQQKFYLYRLAMGATHGEAISPFFKKSIQLVISPVLAKTATIGIVSLPGMMSGQIIGGSSPATAIKYQIAIMIAIFTTSMLSVSLNLILSTKKTFDTYGVLIDQSLSKN